MKTKLLSLLFVLIVFILNSSCTKDLFEPNINGTWVEIDTTAAHNLLNCELIIDKESGDVSICGISVIQPNNAVALTARAKSKLFVEDGQIWYKEKTVSMLWLFTVAHVDKYFLDYEFDGSYLWIIGDDTPTKVSAKGNGRLFKKL